MAGDETAAEGEEDGGFLAALEGGFRPFGRLIHVQIQLQRVLDRIQISPGRREDGVRLVPETGIGVLREARQQAGQGQQEGEEVFHTSGFHMHKYIKFFLQPSPCATLWHKQALPLHQKQNERAMKNTDFNIDALGNMISSDISFQALKDIIDDLGLELEDALAC